MKSSARPRFKRGDRVVRIETGKVGTVQMQFMDGYVSLTFDDGTPAELDASSLKKISKNKRNSSHPRH